MNWLTKQKTQKQVKMNKAEINIRYRVLSIVIISVVYMK
jgi:hypothetical protein